jgi:hypothetical protein
VHLAPFPRSSAIDLPPFALQWVLPIPDYYDGSVTVGLAPGRPSRVPVVLNVLARRRCPIHPLQCARCTSPIMRRVFGTHRVPGSPSCLPCLGQGAAPRQRTGGTPGGVGKRAFIIPIPSLLCPAFLNEAEQRVEKNYTQNDPMRRCRRAPCQASTIRARSGHIVEGTLARIFCTVAQFLFDP